MPVWDRIRNKVGATVDNARDYIADLPDIVDNTIDRAVTLTSRRWIDRTEFWVSSWRNNRSVTRQDRALGRMDGRINLIHTQR